MRNCPSPSIADAPLVLLAGAENAVEFLSGLSGLAAAAVSGAAGEEIECAVTVKVRRRPATAAGSSRRAMELDQLEQAIGDGPCIRALRDASTDRRYCIELDLGRTSQYAAAGLAGLASSAAQA